MDRLDDPFSLGVENRQSRDLGTRFRDHAGDRPRLVRALAPGADARQDPRRARGLGTPDVIIRYVLAERFPGDGRTGQIEQAGTAALHFAQVRMDTSRAGIILDVVVARGADLADVWSLATE